MKLHIKITLIISIVLVAVFGLAGLLLRNHIHNETLDHVINKTETNALSVSKDISNIFENASLATQYMAFQHSIQEYLKDVNLKEDVDSHKNIDEVFETLVEVKENSEHHFLVWIANERADFYIDHNYYISGDDYHVKERPWYNVGNYAIGVGITEPYLEWETQEMVISFIQALRENGLIYGYVAVDIILENIPDMLEIMKVTDQDKIFLITDQNIFIYSSVNSQDHMTNMFDKDFFFNNKSHIERADGKFIEVRYNNKNYLLSSHLVDERGWKIVTMIDEKAVTSEVRQSTDPVFYVSITALFIMLIAIYLTIKCIMAGYSKLSVYGQDIANGHYDKNIPENLIKRRDELGGLSGAFQSIVDTFRKANNRLEEVVDQKNEELASQFELLVEQEKQAALGSLVSGVAHELNTPLGNSLSMSTFMSRETNYIKDNFLDGKLKKSQMEKFFLTQHETLELLETSIKDATSIIDKFNLISMREKGERLKSFSVYDVLMAVKESKKNALDKHKIEIVCDKELYLLSYSSSLVQVINQLIDNSIQHGFLDMPKIIEILVESDDDFVYINYRDNGKGLSSDSIEKVYDMFYTTDRVSGSVGLGMYMVYNTISQNLGGTIEFKGSEYDGVDFQIKLPKK